MQGDVMAIITPVIMSGGAGTRLWPTSRGRQPKQLHRLVGEQTLLRQTLERVAPGSDGLFGRAMVICNVAYADESARQLADMDPVLVLEPFGRNTAACAAVSAAWAVAEGDPQALILLAPADHVVANPEAFRQAVARAVPAARDGRLVTFPIKPTHAETGYGYVRLGEPLGEIFEAGEFVEKPDLPTAEAYLADGRYFWNGGYFLFRADWMLEQVRALQPAIAAASEAALAGAARNGARVALDPDAFAACPSDSIDYAIAEKVTGMAASPFEAGWSDLGSWAAIWEASTKDAAGNATAGDVLLVGAEGCLVQTDGPLVAVVEAQDLVVVVKDGAVLIVPRAQAQRVKAVVDALKAAGRTDLL